MSLAFDPIRRRNVTATEMATLFGLNPFESPSKLLDKKLNPIAVTSIHLRRGRLREPSVLEAFKIDLDMDAVRHEGGTLELVGYRIAATPDAYVKDKNQVIEAKSVLGRNLEKWYQNPPMYYVMQVMVQLLVTDFEFGYLGALEESDPELSEFRFIAWKVNRSEELEKLMVAEAMRFWDSVEADKLFRVNSKAKSKATELIKKSIERIYPLELPVKEEEDESTELSKFISLFD